MTGCRSVPGPSFLLDATQLDHIDSVSSLIDERRARRRSLPRGLSGPRAILLRNVPKTMDAIATERSSSLLPVKPVSRANNSLKISQHGHGLPSCQPRVKRCMLMAYLWGQRQKC